jgi:GH18 family chitinase
MSYELEGKWKELFFASSQLSPFRLSVGGHKVDLTVGLDIVQPRQIADRDEEWNCGVPAYGRKLQSCSCPA